MIKLESICSSNSGRIACVNTGSKCASRLFNCPKKERAWLTFQPGQLLHWVSMCDGDAELAPVVTGNTYLKGHYSEMLPSKGLLKVVLTVVGMRLS